MTITFKNKRLQKLCENNTFLTKKYGPRNARKIKQRLEQLCSSDNLEEMPPEAGTHPLDHNRKGQYAVHLIHPDRLIFAPNDDFDSKDIKTIKNITILEINDYH